METTETKHFSELTLETLQPWLSDLGEPKYRAPQILDWVFTKRVFDPNLFSNLSKKVRDQLLKDYDWKMPEIIESHSGEDGATKLLINIGDKFKTEAVILRYDNRTSLCVSSQVGCKLACSFCQTGKLGFFRHLAASEIIAQFCLAQTIVEKEDRSISHIVFMGMGEPLDNYKNTVQAVNVFTDPKKFGLSASRVTVSTSGMVPKIDTLSDDCRCALAISLHACNDELRTEMMPINRKYPLARLKESLVNYQQKTNKKITIEYILIADLNSQKIHAKQLLTFLSGLKVKVNLIPFNSHPGLPYQRPSEEQIEKFQSYLTKGSIAAPVRYSKGLDVSGACGQLAAKNAQMIPSLPERKNVLT